MRFGFSFIPMARGLALGAAFFLLGSLSGMTVKAAGGVVPVNFATGDTGKCRQHPQYDCWNVEIYRDCSTKKGNQPARGICVPAGDADIWGNFNCRCVVE